MRNKITEIFGSILWETKLEEHLAEFYEKQNYRNIWLDFMSKKIQEDLAGFYEKQNCRKFWLDFMRNKITGTFGSVKWETKLQEHLAQFYERQN